MTGETLNFAVYSKDGCPYCEKIVQVLELSNLNTYWFGCRSSNDLANRPVPVPRSTQSPFLIG